MGSILRRVAHAILLLLAVSLGTFVLADWAPGDFLADLRSDPSLSADSIEALRVRFGLDEPLPVRYTSWLGGVLRGDLGRSFVHGVPVTDLLRPRLGATLLLGATATATTWLLALLLGAAAGLRPGRFVDRATVWLESSVLALPEVVLALLGLLLAVRVAWLPLGGMTSLDIALADGGSISAWSKALDVARHLLMPTAVLTLAGLPVLTCHVRAAVGDALRDPALQAARGHGVAGLRWLGAYLLPAALRPLISLAGLSFGALLSGSLVVEVVFSWPGLGPLLLEAIRARDLHVVVAAVLASATLLIAGNLAADLGLRLHDPRLDGAALEESGSR